MSFICVMSELIIYIIPVVLGVCRHKNTYCVDKDISNLLQGVPMINPVADLGQELLVQAADLGNLVEDVPHEIRVSKTGCLGSLQRL